MHNTTHDQSGDYSFIAVGMLDSSWRSSDLRRQPPSKKCETISVPHDRACESNYLRRYCVWIWVLAGDWYSRPSNHSEPQCLTFRLGLLCGCTSPVPLPVSFRLGRSSFKTDIINTIGNSTSHLQIASLWSQIPRLYILNKPTFTLVFSYLHAVQNAPI